MNNNIRDYLLSIRDDKLKAFQEKLIPTVSSESIIGIKTDVLKEIAKKMENKEEFLNSLPHKYFEENQIHAFIISNIKSYDLAVEEIEKFFPCIDNWATCDQLIPKVFKKNTDALIIKIKEWIKSNEVYKIRFSIKMLMSFYLDSSFKKEYLSLVNEGKELDYYIEMMKAWYYATALAKKYDDTIEYILKGKLSINVLNKTIQKAVESLRISEENKAYLKTLKKTVNK